MKFSFVIPCNNEDDSMHKLVEDLTNFDIDSEIIISSCIPLKSLGKNVQIIESSYCSRGAQLNAGANVAKGDVLVFVHSDSSLSRKALNEMVELFKSDSTEAATFCLGFDNNNFALRIYSFFSRFESIFTTFGDQAICVRKETFDKLGGFPNYRIMEDVAFLRMLRKSCGIKKIKCKIVTSAGRFKKKGYIKTQLLNLIYIIRFLTGTNPDKIYNKYYAE